MKLCPVGRTSSIRGPPVATATYEDTSVVDTAALMRAIAERSEAPAGESAEPPTEETPWA